MDDLKNIGFFAHHFPFIEIQSQYMKSAWCISYDNHSIDFADSNKLAAYSNQSISIGSSECKFKSNHISITAQESIFYECNSSIKFKAKQLQAKTLGAEIKIDDHGIEFRAHKIYLSTPECLQPVSISCVGDKHQCPMVSASGAPHMGGEIVQGSSNVFLNSKAVVRHGDKALCQTSMTQVVSFLKSIKVNGKAIAHALANTTHQGKVLSTARAILSNLTVADTHQTISNEAQEVNKVDITIKNFSSSRMPSLNILLNTQSSNYSVKIDNQIASFNRINTQEIKGMLQFTVFDRE